MGKRDYNRAVCDRIEVRTQSSILAASIINNATIMAIGQEIGNTYDFSNDATAESGKRFNHEWE